MPVAATSATAASSANASRRCLRKRDCMCSPR